MVDTRGLRIRDSGACPEMSIGDFSPRRADRDYGQAPLAASLMADLRAASPPAVRVVFMADFTVEDLPEAAFTVAEASTEVVDADNEIGL